MKVILIIFFSLAITLPAKANTARCATISDHDSRMMCMAVATQNSSYCSFIKGNDSRMKCYISLGR